MVEVTSVEGSKVRKAGVKQEKNRRELRMC